MRPVESAECSLIVNTIHVQNPLETANKTSNFEASWDNRVVVVIYETYGFDLTANCRMISYGYSLSL